MPSSKRIRKIRRKIRHGQHNHEEINSTNTPANQDTESFQSDILNMQGIVGNQAVMQMMRQGDIDQPKTESAPIFTSSKMASGQTNKSQTIQRIFGFGKKKTPKVPTFRVQFVVYPSQEAEDWHDIQAGRKAASQQETKAAKKAAKDKRSDDKSTFSFIKKNVKSNDKLILLHSDSLRMEFGYNYNQINEIYPPVKSKLNDLIPNSLKYSPDNINKGTKELMEIAYGDPTVLNDARLAMTDLDDDALEAMEDFSFDDYDRTFGNDKLNNIKESLEDASQSDAIEVILDSDNEDQPGMVLSESHSDEATKKFIIDNMANLKAQGVDTIYLEVLREEYQPMIDEYLSSGKKKAMPYGLERFIDSSDQNFGLLDKYPNNLKGIVDKAKQLGLNVKGIDTVLAARSGTGGLEGRVRRMNHFAAETIKNDPERAGKFIALIGAAHAYTHENSTGDKGYAGIAQLLDTIAVKIEGGSVTLQNEDKGNRD